MIARIIAIVAMAAIITACSARTDKNPLTAAEQAIVSEFASTLPEKETEVYVGFCQGDVIALQECHKALQQRLRGADAFCTLREEEILVTNRVAQRFAPSPDPQYTLQATLGYHAYICPHRPALRAIAEKISVAIAASAG